MTEGLRVSYSFLKSGSCIKSLFGSNVGTRHVNGSFGHRSIHLGGQSGLGVRLTPKNKFTVELRWDFSLYKWYSRIKTNDVPRLVMFWIWGWVAFFMCLLGRGGTLFLRRALIRFVKLPVVRGGGSR